MYYPGRRTVGKINVHSAPPAHPQLPSPSVGESVPTVAIPASESSTEVEPGVSAENPETENQSEVEEGPPDKTTIHLSKWLKQQLTMVVLFPCYPVRLEVALSNPLSG